MTSSLLEILEPIQKDFQSSSEWKEIEQKAFPTPEVKKKEKKVKDRGSRFPGAKQGVEAQPDGHVEGKAQNQVKLATGAEAAVENLDVGTKS